MARTTKMYANRDVTLRSTKGPVIRFKKNEPKNVPKSIEDEAMRIGIIPVEPEDVGKEEVSQGPAKPETAQERHEVIRDAVDAMIEANDRNEFNASGLPKTNSLSTRVGFKVDASERDKAFEEATAPSEGDGDETGQATE